MNRKPFENQLRGNPERFLKCLIELENNILKNMRLNLNEEERNIFVKF